MELKTIIGKNIRDFREKLGYSIKNIANFLDVSEKTIELYEKAEKSITIIHLEKLSDLFGVEEYSLFEPDAVNKIRSSTITIPKEKFNEEDLEQVAAFRKVIKNYIKMQEINKEQ
jgi:predicted transcriptional regulator